jgi:hypothetical protein
VEVVYRTIVRILDGYGCVGAEDENGDKAKSDNHDGTAIQNRTGIQRIAI